MKVIFEPTERFSNLPEDYQKAAREYLIGKEFDSLHNGLHSIEEQDRYPNIRFHIGKVDIKPRELPATITRAPIIAYYCINGESQSHEIEALVAKLKE